MKVSQEEYRMLLTSLAEYIGKRRYLGGDEPQATLAENFLNKIQDAYSIPKNIGDKSEEEYKKSTLGSCKFGSCE